ncbi:MAG TPA: iron-sulfur cluster assembly accessory protein [Chitinophagaceae bacterium]|nr:iron-sulfur cluster assembly accessory protein [Chitinophagaceae bacterium]HMZ46147.1 iron-sulfur cluster assembly accessory protein [Chitinophagaceae bacterium]HNF30163.1 iron-sulfur cluster assembly accessory protein [Chitinophagaceae bacterium]HNL83318.1 iron-sulfur cluster assembly accessory protein [Chitinophagaceae bacterium]
MQGSLPVSFTIDAINEIKRLISEEDFNASKKLRVGVKGGGCSGMTYVLGFDEPTAEDTEYTTNDFSFIMNKSHSLYLIGMQIDWSDGLNSRGFTFTNPNVSKTCGCGTSFAV